MAIKSKTTTHRLMRLVTDIMGGTLSPSKKLDRIVWFLSAAFSSDVVSIYIIPPRQKDDLLLYTEKGLKLDSSETITLKIGESAIGEVARLKKTLLIEKLQNYPLFSFNSGFEKDQFSTFLGVPLLYGGKILGVLCLQTRESRSFQEEEIDTLEMVAMTVSEIILHKILPSLSQHQKKIRLHTLKEDTDTFDTKELSNRLLGVSLSPGIAIGKAVLYSPTFYLHTALTKNKTIEYTRLKEAFSILDHNLKLLSKKYTHLLMKSEGTREQELLENPQDILETYHMFSKDSGWLNRLHKAIDTGLTAEAALQKVYKDMRKNLLSAHDPFFIELLYDFEDLTHRLVRVLNGDKDVSKPKKYNEDIILFAKNLGPAELLEHYTSHLKGIILEEGSSTSHVSILARSLNIPVLGWVPDLFSHINTDDTIVLDATSGVLFINPPLSVQKAYTQEINLLSQNFEKNTVPSSSEETFSQSFFSYHEEGIILSKDNIPIELYLNAGLSLDVMHMHSLKARGIGLFRTEIPFMLEEEYPDVATQIKIYKKIIHDAGGKPIIFRTLDIGGDKPLPYFELPKEQNPLMGWRAMRIGLDRPSLFRHQLRALIRASQGTKLCLMFPMISTISELETAKKYVELEIERERDLKKLIPSTLEIGVTIEVPSLTWDLPTLTKQVDFISVGTNDLFQFFFACDRENSIVSQRYDPLCTSFLKLLHSIQQTISRKETPLSLCGEMASRPLEALALLGLGYNRLSVSTSCYLSIKNLIQQTEIKKVQSFIKKLLLIPSSSIREKLIAYTLENNYPIFLD